jgi:hypothetical protein
MTKDQFLADLAQRWANRAAAHGWKGLKARKLQLEFVIGAAQALEYCSMNLHRRYAAMWHLPCYLGKTFWTA